MIALILLTIYAGVVGTCLATGTGSLELVFILFPILACLLIEPATDICLWKLGGMHASEFDWFARLCVKFVKFKLIPHANGSVKILISVPWAFDVELSGTYTEAQAMHRVDEVFAWMENMEQAMKRETIVVKRSKK